MLWTIARVTIFVKMLTEATRALVPQDTNWKATAEPVSVSNHE